jgi:hypothetical protein
MAQGGRMSAALTAFAATALLVFGRAFQSINVVRGHYLAAALTPFAIAAGEIAVVGAIVVSGWSAWPWIGAGGSVGAVGAMVLHRRTVGKQSARNV